MKTILSVRKFLVTLSLVCFAASGWQGVSWAAEDPQSSSQHQVMSTININEASAMEIAEALQGVGEKRAQAIVAYREKNGAFQTLDDLKAVKGIGDKTLEDNASKISF